MQVKNIIDYEIAQKYARDTMSYLTRVIRAGMNEKQIVVIAEEYLMKMGVDFWYYGIGAFVFVGKRTCISESGKIYKPTGTVVEEEDIITVDLSPSRFGYWGDYARTLVVSGGKVIGVDSCDLMGVGVKNDFLLGIMAEEQLHRKFREAVTPEKTFDYLFMLLNIEINRMGYVNLDFKGNLGHTIEKELTSRAYIEKGCKTRFGDIGLFTFEPHIKKEKGERGFKREDIYYFYGFELKKL